MTDFPRLHSVGLLGAKEIGERLGQIEPTARGDMLAEKVRHWYEANRESWWDRVRPGADRRGAHADEFMLRLIGAVGDAEREIRKIEGRT